VEVSGFEIDNKGFEMNEQRCSYTRAEQNDSLRKKRRFLLPFYNCMSCFFPSASTLIFYFIRRELLIFYFIKRELPDRTLFGTESFSAPRCIQEPTEKQTMEPVIKMHGQYNKTLPVAATSSQKNSIAVS
jgi:hypothetical protein